MNRLNKSKKGCKDQESIQSSTTPDQGYRWESDKLTADTTNESQEVNILNFNISWVIRKMNIFGGMKVLWISFGVITKLEHI